MSEKAFPTLGLAEAIMNVIAEHTGRSVTGVEVYAFAGGYLSVTVALQDDGSLKVDLSDPTMPGSAR